MYVNLTEILIVICHIRIIYTTLRVVVDFVVTNVVLDELMCRLFILNNSLSIFNYTPNHRRNRVLRTWWALMTMSCPIAL